MIKSKQSLSSVGEETTLTRAHKASDSLRTTVPKSIIKHYKLKEGDKLEWNWHVLEGKMVVVLSPVTK